MKNKAKIQSGLNKSKACDEEKKRKYADMYMTFFSLRDAGDLDDIVEPEVVSIPLTHKSSFTVIGIPNNFPFDLPSSSALFNASFLAM